MPARRLGRGRLIATAIAAVAVLAACSPSKHQAADTGAGTGDSGAASSSTPVQHLPSSAEPTDTITVTAPPSSSSPPAPPSTPPSSATSTPTNPGPPTCTTANLKITVLRGSGAAGHQFAELDFTNAGPATCSLLGFPGVSLRAGGVQLGAPAQRSNKPVVLVALAPGKKASTTLTDNSTCNAPNSDTVRIYPPNQTVAVDIPLSLRGCSLTIDPVALTAG